VGPDGGGALVSGEASRACGAGGAARLNIDGVEASTTALEGSMDDPTHTPTYLGVGRGVTLVTRREATNRFLGVVELGLEIIDRKIARGSQRVVENDRRVERRLFFAPGSAAAPPRLVGITLDGYLA
jgi:hypothetical protein